MKKKTNDEWLCTCSPEERAEWLSLVCVTAAYKWKDENKEKLKEEQWRKWLKEPH